MSQLPANAAWFLFTVSGGPDFAVYAFSGRERVSEPYEFSVELVSPRHDVDLTDLIGRNACLTIADKSGAARAAHGVIRAMEQGHSGNARTRYRCVLAPRLWFLGRNRDQRIFQHKSVPDIITHILEGPLFPPESFAFKCFHTYQPREYCVQYGESDLHFLSRLCEEEGIYYYFEHSEAGHCLCFSDMPGGPRIMGESDLRFHRGSGQPADTAVISRAELNIRAESNTATLRDWNFLTPAHIPEGAEQEPDYAKAPHAPGIDYDVYRYPHLFQTQAEAERYANLQLLRQMTFKARLDMTSDVSRFLPGFTFHLHDHERADVNAAWWVSAVEQTGEQPQVLESEAPDRGMSYRAEVTAIPETTRYVPPCLHRKNRVPGDQTAIVTGPACEEIYPDKYGRVKVQFFWDRKGRQDEYTTCWIRPSQGWAGTEFGTVAMPRIGHEVVVSFLEGDPDRPVITGRLYHADNMPPYALPAHKTRTVLKIMSTPGATGARGFNELRIEDKAGEEEIFVHAEKDMGIHVKNDWKEHILHDRHQTVDRHTYVHTTGETHASLKGQRRTELFAADNLTLYADSHLKVDGKLLGDVGQEIHVKAGGKMVLEAGSELTVMGGGSWMKVDSGGVHVTGPLVSLSGGGSSGSESASAPALPDSAAGVELSRPPRLETLRFPPGQKKALIEAARDHKVFCAVCAEEAKEKA